MHSELPGKQLICQGTMTSCVDLAMPGSGSFYNLAIYESIHPLIHLRIHHRKAGLEVCYRST